jgi:hypothetical protein
VQKTLFERLWKLLVFCIKVEHVKILKLLIIG